MIHLLHNIGAFITSHGGSGQEESVSDIVMHHLTDSVITAGPESNVIIKFISDLNNTVLSQKLFGIFDMRITRWILMMWIALLLCLLVFIPVARKIKKAKLGSSSRWVQLWEVLIGFVHDEIVEPNFDHHYVKKAMPYFGTLFFFILFCNLLGMVPGMSTATGNLAVTAGLASLTLLGMIVVGSVKQGPLWIITGVVPHGIPVFLFPLMWVIEVMGLLIKPFALTVRLFANMTAGHIVIIIFIYLVMMFKSYWVGIGSVTGALMISMLELLVAFIQAYIFAALTAMFVGQSMHAH
ncbi:MAG TPA: F0F1 ATP synthase subunit A [Spirochaetota bacterium]|jgi:F-type H+-transporting ATPase subunit a|nr:F0F1 ATP synthase subunit A [Spirochaetota bacterium]HQO01424.1 F0F1 ATP synthase subunit A [Spirochaetota bacterium]HQP48461.1 F0F1 ATP synthase subunit A [Spirochaetota bacterium]